MDTRVTTRSGVVRGTVEDGLHVFRGIPFAAPPFGDRRFLPPVPPEPWEGVRDATRSGVGAPQPRPRGEDPWAAMYAPRATGADCLTLDVWTPEPGAASRPVVVHIHGGGYLAGSPSAPAHSGRSFARDGVVHVSIGYRLGIDGFLLLDDGPDNLGLRDQVAGLEWVRHNIAGFGGDPDAVTLMGQSAGAVSVFTHLAMLASDGLFHRAIAQSGSPSASVDVDTARRQTHAVARALRVPPTVEGFRSLTIDRTTAAAQKMATRFAIGLLRGDPESLMVTPFRTVHGTALLPTGPSAGGLESTVPLLAGTVEHETVAFVQALTGSRLVRPWAHRSLWRALGGTSRDRRRHRGEPDRLIEAAWTDRAFRAPTLDLVERRLGPSWLYEFTWRSAGEPLGSVHGIDLLFSGDTLSTAELLGADARRYFDGAPQALADSMHDAFTAFVTDGDPGWPQYARTAPHREVFDGR